MYKRDLFICKRNDSYAKVSYSHIKETFSPFFCIWIYLFCLYIGLFCIYIGLFSSLVLALWIMAIRASTRGHAFLYRYTKDTDKKHRKRIRFVWDKRLWPLFTQKSCAHIQKYEWCMRGVWVVYEWYMSGVWGVYEWCMRGVWVVYEGCGFGEGTMESTKANWDKR